MSAEKPIGSTATTKDMPAVEPRPAAQPATPADPRDRRVYVWWGVGLALLAVTGAVCWLLVRPALQAREAVRLWASGQTWAPTEVERLGGPDAAPWKLKLFLHLPARLAPQRREAVGLLQYAGETSDSAIPVLISLLADEDPKVRQAAAGSLEYLVGAWTGASIRKDPPPEPKVHLLPQVIEAMTKAVGDTDAKTRSLAATVLGYSREPRVLPALLGALRDPDAQVRRAALWSLGNCNYPEIIPALEAALKDPDQGMVWDAMHSLASKGQTQYVEPFIAMLRDPDPWRRRAAAYALGAFKDRRAVEPLIETLNDPNRNKPDMGYVALAAAESLGKLGDRRAVEPLVATLQDRTWDGRWSAAGPLGQIGDPRAVGPLLAVLHDRSLSWRRDAIEALAGIKDSQVIPVLIATLADRSEVWDVREEAAKALGTLGDRRALDVLASAAGDENVNVSSAAAEALKKIRGEEAGK